jgi:DNA replication protein DnaC
LLRLGWRATATALDDFVARATQQKWSPRQVLEELARSETADKAARQLESRLRTARLGRFKPLVDFDWDWPKKIDRPLLERWLRLECVTEPRNLILLGANGLGKTTLARNLAYQAVLAGHSVLFRSAAELLADLQCESPPLRKRKLQAYGRADLLVIDEVGYLAYDAAAADLLYEVVNRRYETGPLVLTTNRAFKDWHEVFPHATSIGAMLDRLLHHADVVLLEGASYRQREREAESTARRAKP